MNSNNTVFPRDIVCLRNISINTLHKRDMMMMMMMIIIMTMLTYYGTNKCETTTIPNNKLDIIIRDNKKGTGM